ncbi:hypothetical protein D3C87_1642130 [compost metagenome]
MRGVECQVQFQDVDPRLAKEPKQHAFRVLGNELTNALYGQAAHPRDSTRLIQGCGDADMRIKTASRTVDQVGGHRGGVPGIGRTQGIDAALDRVRQYRVQWPKV